MAGKKKAKGNDFEFELVEKKEVKQEEKEQKNEIIFYLNIYI